MKYSSDIWGICLLKGLNIGITGTVFLGLTHLLVLPRRLAPPAAARRGGVNRLQRAINHGSASRRGGPATCICSAAIAFAPSSAALPFLPADLLRSFGGKDETLLISTG